MEDEEKEKKWKNKERGEGKVVSYGHMEGKKNWRRGMERVDWMISRGLRIRLLICNGGLM
jgi:hypothetical protein